MGGEEAHQTPGLPLGGFALVLQAAAVFLCILALPLEAAVGAFVQVASNIVGQLKWV